MRDSRSIWASRSLLWAPTTATRQLHRAAAHSARPAAIIAPGVCGGSDAEADGARVAEHGELDRLAPVDQFAP